ncbi:MAG: Tol-Pal system protein TolB [Hyphomonas sp.]|nr:Tol-Pal system protein TolB [Hyphomonas sp.]MBU3922216.1 Tol-Pal system protein TolB [Alphaproteobacteria bacterium]MBU4061674.1 Tol-Pal system protein TolB [Alphaproteobacteria bacterium]MBU4163519.1 Tol-Pal system protein TolB [Alphaproteobacteria bacterium]
MNYLRHFLAVMLIAVGLAAPASAQLRVRVDEGNFKPTPIAIPDFQVTGANADLARQIVEVVRADLASTGLFDLQNPASFIQKDQTINAEPRFADWKIIRTEGLVIGAFEELPDGKVAVSFRLWDIYGGELMRINGEPGRRLTTTPENWRRIAHKIADSIYTRLTGEDPYFDTRIVYIAETGPKTERVKRLAIMDSDGANQQYLTSGRSIVLTPRFSPSAQEITYMSFEGGKPRVYLFNIETGRQELLGNFPGMTFAPRFSRDGQSVLLSQAQRGNTDIYVMNLRTRESSRLTDHPSIDTSPSMSPDGKSVVFNSDRGGSPQLYIMNTDGTQRACPSGGRDVACRITFGKGRYSTPVWSPRGDLIAFTKQEGGKFYIGVIGTDGKGERLLTEAYLDEGPDWSPNGRVIVYFREARAGASPQLWSVDLSGRNERRMVTQTDASDPAWSPLLQ